MEFNYPKPEPWRRIEDNAKLCPWCNDERKQVIIKGKSFLCKPHYVEFRRQRERARIKQKREEFPDHDINKPGTTDFGSKPVRKPDGKIDFDREAKIVHNELMNVFKGWIENKTQPNTPGWRRADYQIEEADLPQEQEPVYDDDYSREVLLYQKEIKPRSLKEVYQEWSNGY